MRLRSFRVCGFRCIKDSGWIEVRNLVALVGRNESGKTALLQSLLLLNKDTKIQPEDLTDGLEPDQFEENEFPNVIDAKFVFSDQEKDEIKKAFPEFPALAEINIYRSHDDAKPQYGQLSQELPDVVSINTETVAAIKPHIEAAKQLLAAPTADLALSTSKLQGTDSQKLDALKKGLKSLSELQTKPNLKLQEDVTSGLTWLLSLEGLIPATLTIIQTLSDGLNSLHKKERGEEAFFNFIEAKFHPSFVYFSSYKAIHGNVRLSDYTTDVADGTTLKLDTGESLDRKETVDNLFYLADLDPKKLSDVAPSPTKRSKYLGDCARNLTKEIQRGWIGEGAKIECDLDYSDDILTVKIINVNDDGTRSNQQLLQRRSEGFRWQFSFQVNFKAETKKSALKEAIILLDEPGLHLHPAQQEGLLKIIQELANDNQIIYTTHSPFMIFDYTAGSLLLVEIDRATKLSKVTSEFWNGSTDALLPVLHSLGAKFVRGLTEKSDFAQLLPPVLVVEGTTDYKYIKAVNYLFKLQQVDGTADRNVLDLDIIPANGSSAIRPTALFHQRLGHRVIALFDKEPDAEKQAEELKKEGFPAENIVFIPVADHKSEADIEDLFPEGDYLKHLNEFYKNTLLHARYQILGKDDLKKVRNSDVKLIRTVLAVEAAWKVKGTPQWGTFSKADVCDKICTDILQNKSLTENPLKAFNDLFGHIRKALGLSVFEITSPKDKAK
ncbi:MAG: AAA family ATPase [Methylacidiphilales bacterium]|nr:AAA family ATPase [Candidatus Methylacidiphilales bacterium]